MPADTPTFNLELQKAFEPFIDPYLAEEFQYLFPVIVPGMQPPAYPNFWQMMVSFFHKNEGCAAHSFAMANMKKHWKALQKNSKIPPAVRNNTNPKAAIGMWLTLQMYLCVWNKTKVWVPKTGIAFRVAMEEIICCKYDIMKEYGIEECVSVHGAARNTSVVDVGGMGTLYAQPPCCITYKANTTKVGVPPLVFDIVDPDPVSTNRLDECCDENGCEVILHYRMPTGHVVNGTLTCENGRFIVELNEHPLQSGAETTIEIHPPGTNPSDPTNANNATSTIVSESPPPSTVSPEQVATWSEMVDRAYGQGTLSGRGYGAAIDKILCYCD